MKKKLFNGTAAKIFLAINCLIFAIIFWILVKLVDGGELPFISSIFC